MKIQRIDQPGFEEVWEAREEAIGFQAYIALHDTRLGPALGGVRFWPYPNSQAALADVLRLAQAMTYKAAVADLPHGGGKGVIIQPPGPFDRPVFIGRFAEFIKNLHGKYITAKDVGTNAQDMTQMRKTTRWVTGLLPEAGGAGDPSPLTAFGVLVGIQACLEEKRGNSSFEGIHVAIQGLGGVGAELSRLIIEQGGEVWGSDLNPKNLVRCSQLWGVHSVLPELIFETQAEVFAPCAMGQVLNSETIPKLNTDIVAGGANDQLQNEREDARRLREQGILFAPDFVINAGGLIHVAMELTGYDPDKAKKKTAKIRNTLKEVFQISRAEGITTWQAALQLAKARLSKSNH